MKKPGFNWNKINFFKLWKNIFIKKILFWNNLAKFIEKNKQCKKYKYKMADQK